jgi:hypothetical protein
MSFYQCICFMWVFLYLWLRDIPLHGFAAEGIIDFSQENFSRRIREVFPLKARAFLMKYDTTKMPRYLAQIY